MSCQSLLLLWETKTIPAHYEIRETALRPTATTLENLHRKLHEIKLQLSDDVIAAAFTTIILKKKKIITLSMIKIKFECKTKLLL